MTTVAEPLQEIAGLITLDAEGMARIAGSRIKVAHLAVEHTREGRTPEGIVAAHPHLTLAQVEAALSYYYAHRSHIEAQIAASEQLVERLQAEAGASPVAARLRAEGLVPWSETPTSYP